MNARMLLRMARLLPQRTVNFIRGRFLLRRLIRNRKDDEIYLIFGTAIGDNLYGLAYLDALHEKFPDKKFIVFSSEKNYTFLKTYKNIDELRLYAPEKCIHAKLIIESEQLYKSLAENIIVPEPLYYRRFRGDKELGSLHLLKKYIYGLPEDTPARYHGLTRIPVVAIKDFDRLKNRIVIINPYETSRNKCREYYTEICDELNSRGYILFTNVTGNQRPLPGTQALNCSLEELYSIACEIPLIVSRRSGILDFLMPSGINMFAIFEVNIFLKYFPLSEWQAKSFIAEIPTRTPDEIKSVPEKFRAFLDELEIR